MADHKAEQIINKLVTATLLDLTTTLANVYRGRVKPLEESVDYALSVSMGSDEPADDELQNNQFIESNLQINIDVIVRGTSDNNGNTDLETMFNLIRKEVHVAMMGDETQGLSFVHSTIPAGADTPELDGEGNAPIGKQRLNWVIQYRSSITDPSL